MPSKGWAAAAVSISDLSKAPGVWAHQGLDGNLAWQSGPTCSGCCTHVALEKNNFRITCSLLVITADTCLFSLELPSTSKFEKCLSCLE